MLYSLRSERLKSIGLCLCPKRKIVKHSTVFVISFPYKMLTWLLSPGLFTPFVNILIEYELGFILIDGADTGNQLFRLRLKLKSTSATTKIRWRVVLQVNVVIFDFFLSSTVSNNPISGKRLYQNQNCIFSCASKKLPLYSLKFYRPPFHLIQLEITE